MTEQIETKIVIVGGGPVGLGLAISLGQRGIDCVVLERSTELHLIPKGQNLTQRSMEHFHFWGAEKQLRAARTVPADWGMGGLTTYKTLLGKYHHDWMRRELVRPYYYTDNERLPQYQTEVVLRARVAELPSVRVFYGWRADAVQQDENAAWCEATSQDGTEAMVVRAPYLVGCDGSRSMVREAAGITQTLNDHNRLMVLLVFRSTGLHEALADHPGKSFFNVLHPELEGYWRFFGRVDLGTTWFFHCPVPYGTTRENFDFAGLLHEAAGAEFDVDFIHIGFWDLRFAVADTYRAGRMFIAGDAAHSHPPYGGYGVNTGFEDATNLAWKLAAKLEGWGGEALLDSYSPERQPVFASTAGDFIARSIEVDRELVETYSPEKDIEAFEAQWAARTGDATTEVHSFEPNYEGSPALFGPPGGVCSAVGKHEFAARAGHHVTPCALSDGRNLFEALGTGFTLVALDAAPADVAAFEAASRQLGVPLSVVHDDRGGGRGRYGSELFLVRPDQFVAWVADGGSPVDAEAVLRRVAGR
jgi:2-polyprenyl-6-methoxyphenol hydroxylase-like FAD-dependent oxidoreductase